MLVLDKDNINSRHHVHLNNSKTHYLKKMRTSYSLSDQVEILHPRLRLAQYVSQIFNKEKVFNFWNVLIVIMKIVARTGLIEVRTVQCVELKLYD